MKVKVVVTNSKSSVNVCKSSCCEIDLPVEEPWPGIVRPEAPCDIVVVRLQPNRHGVPSDGIRKVVGAASRNSDDIKCVLQKTVNLVVCIYIVSKSTYTMEVNGVLSKETL